MGLKQRIITSFNRNPENKEDKTEEKKDNSLWECARQQRQAEEKALHKEQVLKRNCRADPGALEGNRSSSVEFHGFG